jgi:UDP-N-acetylglucosamine:LPS N-acetylglucosamine transferase
MHELMQISDLFIGKPGGLTTSEALACGLPMVIFSPIPGQEERNSDHLLEDGVAIKCNELTTIPFKIDRLLDDPQRLEGCVAPPAPSAGRMRQRQSSRRCSMTSCRRSCSMKSSAKR